MGIIKALKLMHDYYKYDENGHIEETHRALDDINLDIEQGQFIAVLGHNGSGKSTLAKHINALLYPTEGAMVVDGINTSTEEEIWKVRQKAGMVFQNPDNQIIGSIVEEDVGFGPENMGVETDEIWRRVNKSLEATGMTAYRSHSPNKLSGGQKQRVAIAGVMAMEPKCIIYLAERMIRFSVQTWREPARSPVVTKTMAVDTSQALKSVESYRIIATERDFLVLDCIIFSNFCIWEDIPMTTVQDTLRLFGITRCYKGLKHTAYVIELAVQEESRLEAVTKEIYTETASHFGCKWTAVERNIRTAGLAQTMKSLGIVVPTIKIMQILI